MIPRFNISNHKYLSNVIPEQIILDKNVFEVIAIFGLVSKTMSP